MVFFGPGTFTKKERLKSLGAKFNFNDKTWVLDLLVKPGHTDDSQSLSEVLGVTGAKLVGLDSGPTSMKLPEANSATPAKSSGRLAASNEIDSSDPKDPGSMMEQALALGGWSIAQLMDQIHRSIALEFANPIWVVAEIQSLSQRSGHLFFELAEPKGQAHRTATVTVKTMLWSSQAKYLIDRMSEATFQQIFADGNLVRLLVRVSLYKDRGQISLQVEDADQSLTLGAMALERQKLLSKLRNLGLDQKNKQTTWGHVVESVVLITAPASRAEGDFVDQLKVSGFFGHLRIIPCAMQGALVPKEVSKAISLANTFNPDAIVLCRGGGSAADLRWFDGEEVAMAIVNSPVPVIVAIGHHDDQSIAEEVAHTRAKTPTAAAEVLIQQQRDFLLYLESMGEKLDGVLHRLELRLAEMLSLYDQRLVLAVFERIRRASSHLDSLSERFSSQIDLRFERIAAEISKWSQEISFASMQRCSKIELDLGLLSRRFQEGIQKSLTKQELAHMRLESELRLRDPTPWLEKGWTQLFSKDSREKITSGQKLQIGQKVAVRLLDALVSLEVESIQNHASTVPRPSKNH